MRRLLLTTTVLLLAAFTAWVLRSPYRADSLLHTTATEFAYPLLCSAQQSDSAGQPFYALRDASNLLGAIDAPRTYALTAADFSGDGRDDLLIGTHNGRPQLLINTAGRLQNRSELVARGPANVDWHALNAIDVDNDGRLDIVIAGGGGEVHKAGTENTILRNNTSDAGVRFTQLPLPPELTEAEARTQAFIPVVSRSGREVDLYAATSARRSHPNRFWRNNSTPGNLQLSVQPEHRMARGFDDTGHGVIADFDSDGHTDYLLIQQGSAEVHWGAADTRPTLLATQARSAAAGDFNNDGLLDLYIGRHSEYTDADRISFNEQQINFVIRQNGRVDHSELSFHAETAQLHFDLRQQAGGRGRQYPAKGTDIFIGRDRDSPGARNFTLHKGNAVGKPDYLRRAGIYIWYSDAQQRWTIRWQFQAHSSVYKGVISGARLSDIRSQGLTDKANATVMDAVLLNRGNGRFERLCTGALSHRLQTAGVTAVDLDNDGWLDIAGVRHAEQGAAEGGVFVIHQPGSGSPQLTRLPRPDEDRLYRADLIVHGFFNDDALPDLAYTQGYGQLPGTGGPARLLLNAAANSNAALVIDLQGTTANSFAVGAQATLFNREGDRLGFRAAGLNTNLSQDTSLLHFGLGDQPPPYSLHVAWPDATESTHTLDTPGFHRVVQPR